MSATEESNNTPGILVALLPTWLAFAWLISKAQWFWTHKPDLQFGWIVVMLCAFLLWDNWAKHPEPLEKNRWTAALGAIAGLIILFAMQIYQAAYGMMPAVLMGLSAGVYAIAAANIYFVFGGAGLRHFAFPLLFLLIALPLPSFLYNPIVNGLQHKVATVNVEVLNMIGVPAQRVGSLIQLPNGTVGVDEACSGIRSLQSTIMATLFIGYLTLKRRSLQVTLLGTGVVLAIFGNLIRSLYLSLTANSRGVEAVKQVHDSAGWSILLFTALGVAATAWLFNKLEVWMRKETEKRTRSLATEQPVN